MRKFKNNIGCTAQFEDGIAEKVIHQKLSFLGNNWIEVDENNIPINIKFEENTNDNK